jgi:peroxiredoxin
MLLSQRTSRRASVARGLLSAVVMGTVIAGVTWFLAGPGGVAGGPPQAPSGETAGAAPRVGKEAPDFRVLQLDGTVARLSDFRGQPVWLSFWATWCPPCRSESAEIESAYQEYSQAGVVVLAIDVGEDAQTVTSYVAKAGLTYPIGLDRSQQIGALYRVAGLPNHFFIDADGVLREWRVGPVDRDSLGKSISAISSRAVPQRDGASGPPN